VLDPSPCSETFEYTLTLLGFSFVNLFHNSVVPMLSQVILLHWQVPGYFQQCQILRPSTKFFRDSYESRVIFIFKLRHIHVVTLDPYWNVAGYMS
jgi:hypothetical protein